MIADVTQRSWTYWLKGADFSTQAHLPPMP
jgi:hypothetical protein